LDGEEEMSNEKELIIDDWRLFEPSDLISESDEPGKWLLLKGRYGARKGWLLYSPEDKTSGDISVLLPVKGRYSIYIGIYHEWCGKVHEWIGGKVSQFQDVIDVKLDSDKFYDVLRYPAQPEVFTELFFKTAFIDNSRLRFFSKQSKQHKACIDYLRLVPVKNDCSAKVSAGEKIIGGMLDIHGEIFSPVEEQARAQVALHKQAGFNQIYWFAWAVVCDYWKTKVGTIRGKCWNVDFKGDTTKLPSSDMLALFDPLEEAVKLGKEYEIDIFGWFRFRNEFFKLNDFGATKMHAFHPDKRHIYKDGVVANSLSLAYDEIKQYYLEICKEILAYGVKGIFFDTLRHPPAFMYETILVERYKKMRGEDPRTMPGDGSEQWLRFRAKYFTDFLRELKKITSYSNQLLYIRVQPTIYQNLRDGFDILAWLDEHLIDGIVLSHYLPAPAMPLKMDIRDIRERCPNDIKLLVNVWRGGSLMDAMSLAADVYNQGADGVTFYDSGGLNQLQERNLLSGFRSHESLIEAIKKTANLDNNSK
jgi:hypothetical protein